jgi:hypothetical protein
MEHNIQRSCWCHALLLYSTMLTNTLCLCRLVCEMKPHAQKVVGLDFLAGPDHFKVVALTLFQVCSFLLGYTVFMWARTRRVKKIGESLEQHRKTTGFFLTDQNPEVTGF